MVPHLNHLNETGKNFKINVAQLKKDIDTNYLNNYKYFDFKILL